MGRAEPGRWLDADKARHAAQSPRGRTPGGLGRGLRERTLRTPRRKRNREEKKGGVHVCWETLSCVQRCPVQGPDTVREKALPPAGPVFIAQRRSESVDVELGEEQQAVHQQPEEQDEVHHVRLLDELRQGVAVRALALPQRGFARVVGLPG